MSKVTSKLQLTVPKVIADHYGIRPGDELEWIPEGDSTRIELSRRRAGVQQLPTREERVALFDQGTKRLARIRTEELNNAARPTKRRKDRGWTREEIYDRGGSR